MKIPTLPQLQYQWNVSLLGGTWLKIKRMRLLKRIERAPASPLFGPPLRSSARLKELISRHYLKGQYAHLDRRTAWVTSGAPAEFLVALGFHLHYPENHGAVCGIRRVAEPVLVRAEEEGWSRDICSYARTDFGTVLSGQTPVGRLPRPDLLVCCTNICQTVLYWYQWLAWHYKCPLVLMDTPFLDRDAAPHDVEYVKRQVETALAVAEGVAGRSLVPSHLEQVTRSAKEAVGLWNEVLLTATHKPAPFTAFDAFIHLAPIVEMRGSVEAVAYYSTLLEELKDRVSRGVAAVKGERIRLLWDNLPIWARVKWLSEVLAQNGATLVASTYTNAWAELYDLIDPANPVDSAARVHLNVLLNRTPAHKLGVLQAMARRYDATGVILHSDRSCKPYSIGQADQRNRLGIPGLVLEADHNDPRAFSEEQARARIQAFLELAGAP